MALRLKELYSSLCKSNPDIKARQLQILVENARRDNELLDQKVRVKQMRFPGYKPKPEEIPEQRYLFPASLLPSLSQVCTIY